MVPPSFKQLVMRRGGVEEVIAMAYIQGEGLTQGTLFPIVLDDLTPSDYACGVIDAFVTRLSMAELGFERAQAAEASTDISTLSCCREVRGRSYMYLKQPNTRS
jgi:hypothetical protein